MADSRHKVGDRVRLWKPGHAEHGLTASVGRVIPIEEYHPECPHRGPHAYWPSKDGWRDGETGWFRTPLPDAMVVNEDEYQRWRAENPSLPSRP